jgi:hypothetical protein
MHFRNLDFFVAMEGELAWAPTLVQPPRSTDIGTIIEVLEELQLRALEVHTPESSQLPNFDYERLKR